MLPASTARLTFREMTDDDLDPMAALLGDPEVMRHYPAPKTRGEAADWISWNLRNYADHGHGLWIIETHDGEFVGDCGLTIQHVDGEPFVEVGYHVATAWQGQGLATEAAAAVRDTARAAGVPYLVAIIRPDNVPSQRVVQKIGLTLERRAVVHGGDALIFGASL